MSVVTVNRTINEVKVVVGRITHVVVGRAGPAGSAATITVGDVISVGPDEDAEVTNTGSPVAAIFDFKIPRGEKGDQGEQGVPGEPGGVTYTHVQDSPLASWNIVHNLGRHPSVTVVDTAGTHFVGAVVYLSVNQIQVDFGAPFSGRAYLN